MGRDMCQVKISDRDCSENEGEKIDRYEDFTSVWKRRHLNNWPVVGTWDEQDVF